MVKILLTAVLVFVLAGCAMGPADPEVAAPTCEAGRECNIKWTAAERWIVHKANRSIAEKTDYIMRTVMDQSPGNYLSVRVERKRIAPGEYRIEAAFFCARKVGCDPTPWEALQDFNRSVNRSWNPLGDSEEQ